jgi:hypothetical protein
MSHEDSEEGPEIETYQWRVLYARRLHPAIGDQPDQATPDHQTPYAESEATAEGLLTLAVPLRSLTPTLSCQERENRDS